MKLIDFKNNWNMHTKFLLIFWLWKKRNPRSNAQDGMNMSSLIFPYKHEMTWVHKWSLKSFYYLLGRWTQNQWMLPLPFFTFFLSIVPLLDLSRTYPYFFKITETFHINKSGPSSSSDQKGTENYIYTAFINGAERYKILFKRRG